MSCEARAETPEEVIVHVIDGTYELFRHFYGQRSWNEGKDKPFGAVAGVLHSVLEMVETGATHVGVATDHVIESFRNDLWPDYKTGEGMEPVLASQFLPLEDALAAMGVASADDRNEADDGLASAARISRGRFHASRKSASGRTTRISVSACARVASSRSSEGHGGQERRRVHKKFGVDAALIPDFLAWSVMRRTANRVSGGIGKSTAASLLNVSDLSSHSPLRRSAISAIRQFCSRHSQR